MSLSEAVSRARSRFNLYVADTDMPSFLAELARCQVTEADFDIAVNRCSRLRETMAPSSFSFDTLIAAAKRIARDRVAVETAGRQLPDFTQSKAPPERVSYHMSIIRALLRGRSKEECES